MYRNSEHYPDPTAGEAISVIMKEHRQRLRQQFREKNRKKVYICSPYAGDVEANTAAARRYSREAIEQGYMPIAPHLLFPQVLDDEDPVERELGLMFGLALLSFCDEVWVYGDELSAGMEREVAEARRMKKPVRRRQVRSKKCGEWSRAYGEESQKPESGVQGQRNILHASGDRGNHKKLR